MRTLLTPVKLWVLCSQLLLLEFDILAAKALSNFTVISPFQEIFLYFVNKVYRTRKVDFKSILTMSTEKN